MFSHAKEDGVITAGVAPENIVREELFLKF
jgi:hypothetical protein